MKKIIEIIANKFSKEPETEVIRYKISSNVDGYMAIYGPDPVNDTFIRI